MYQCLVLLGIDAFSVCKNQLTQSDASSKLYAQTNRVENY